MDIRCTAKGFTRGGLAWTGIILFSVAGCGGGGQMNMDFRRPASERPDLGEPVLSGGAISIPSKEAFNFRSFPSGQVGGGQGASGQVGTDGAVCRAESKTDGSAWGEFQLGYTFDNATSRRVAALVKLRLKVTESGQVSGATAASSGSGGDSGGSESNADALPASAANQLRFVVKDSFGAVLRDENLLSDTATTGGSRSSRAHDVAFDVTLEPDRGYYLVLVGRSDVTGGKGQSVSASIEVSGLSIDVDCSGAGATKPKE
ncbi:hypothetical protein RAS2_35650 [Phycisphaerae bacterium RAS2]|nr:hypothetical protein RAS2_35650 [Phycisphaerae bacterium RAS2]